MTPDGLLGKETAATATHYEILGVDPDASHDEVKRAFTTLALRWHPDRQADPGPAARERAEWRMREINGAWEVLRNPASRAAYDDQLAAKSADGPAVAPHRPSASPGVTGRPPSFADQLVDPTRVDAGDRRPSGRRWMRLAPVLVVVALVVVLAGFGVMASHKPSTPAPPGVELHTEQFEVGSCVAVTPGPEATTVSCSEPNSGQISSTTDYPRPCPPNTATVSLVSRQISLCLVPS
ncbi:MAG TPA: J domain-containing protein [Acidimicrobiales bacterium]